MFLFYCFFPQFLTCKSKCDCYTVANSPFIFFLLYLAFPLDFLFLQQCSFCCRHERTNMLNNWMLTVWRLTKHKMLVVTFFQQDALLMFYLLCCVALWLGFVLSSTLSSAFYKKSWSRFFWAAVNTTEVIEGTLPAVFHARGCYLLCGPQNSCPPGAEELLYLYALCGLHIHLQHTQTSTL